MSKPLRLSLEFLILFIMLPLLLFVVGTRLEIYITIWLVALYSGWILKQSPDFSWQKLWHGQGWTLPEKRIALLRFIVLAVLLAILTLILLPDRFMRFPLDHFPFWVLVMVLYPMLSIIPQELVFRSFYFSRYSGIITEKKYGTIINGLAFGFSHIILNNWIAPTFCAIAGIILARSYQQHRSLKWAVIEHSLYGCWVFTVGMGWYFFTGNWRH